MDGLAFWHCCGAVLLLLLTMIHRRMGASGILFAALWRLPGVLLHELSHLLVGTLLLADPRGMTLWPRRMGNRWRLGGVTFARLTPFNAVPVALAPLGLAVVAGWLAWHWFDWFPAGPAPTITLYCLLYLLLSGAMPSRQDLRIACSWRSLLLYLPLLSLALYWGFQPLLAKLTTFIP